ncbi:MAG TPA: wax ester/triacylglycerol synthase family O-acyltransferase [Rubrivivax sp.]|nr:wax ester/triacylglycerol synthase family O-acyltransferase [Rubrivivax sp.]
MKQLSGLDATFLYLETPQMPMHVGALHVLELPAGFRGQYVTALRKHIASRLPVAPVLRRSLWRMPLNLANPAWVDAVPDLRQHIVEIKLPKGAGLAELEAEVSRLHPILLDRSRPLWKFHVFEGLAPAASGNRRVGLYSQLHHAAVDGQAAVALANLIFDVTAEPRAITKRATSRQRIFKLETGEMLRGVIANQAQKLVHIVKSLPATVGTLKDAASTAVAHSHLLGGPKGTGNLALAPRTALNKSITEGRAYATVSLPLHEVKDIGHAFDATVNDMVLMLCSSALRRYFAKKRGLPRKSLIAAVPISLRDKGDTTADNQASMSLVSLGTHIGDTRKRLAHVQAATAAMKSTMGSLKSILPTDYPSLGIPWLIEAATLLYGKARVADRIPQVANLVISNVPGPQMPLYLAGARILTNYPTSIIVHGMGLNITVQSFGGSLDFGLMADAQAMPDVQDLAQALRVSMDDLRALPRPGEPDPEAPAPEGVVSRATRKLAGGITGVITGAVHSVARTAVGAAVESAVSRVTRQPRANAPAKRRRAG